MNRFATRNAVVTGASRGIGAATAERLAAEGADVVVVARTVAPRDRIVGSLSETLGRCRRFGTNVYAVAADLADSEVRASIVDRAVEMLGGPVDILVNNAAAAIYQPLAEYSLGRRRLMFEVNVHAPLDLSQAVLPAMIERGEGWIVNVSSATAELREGTPREGAPHTGLYGATKAALNRMSNALAGELVGTGIRVNTVAPVAAVMSEGAEALVGDIVSDDQIESMEAMVEAIVLLCACPEEMTAGNLYSLPLLDALGLDVRTLDGAALYPGGHRVWKG